MDERAADSRLWAELNGKRFRQTKKRHEADEEKQLLIEEGKTDEIAEPEADQRLGLHALLPVYELALGSRFLER